MNIRLQRSVHASVCGDAAVNCYPAVTVSLLVLMKMYGASDFDLGQAQAAN